MAKGGVLTAAVVVGATAVILLLVREFGYQGILLSVGVAAAVGLVLFRRDSERELRALRHSIEHSASDIRRVLGQWHDFHRSGAPEHVRDRVRHRPRLLNRNCGVESVRRFHDAVRSAEDHLHRLPGQVAGATSVAALTAVLHETDRMAAGLDTLWTRARREASTPDLG